MQWGLIHIVTRTNIWEKSGLVLKERSFILKIPSGPRFPQHTPLGNLTPELINLTTVLFSILVQHKRVHWRQGRSYSPLHFGPLPQCLDMIYQYEQLKDCKQTIFCMLNMPNNDIGCLMKACIPHLQCSPDRSKSWGSFIDMEQDSSLHGKIKKIFGLFQAPRFCDFLIVIKMYFLNVFQGAVKWQCLRIIWAEDKHGLLSSQAHIGQCWKGNTHWRQMESKGKGPGNKFCSHLLRWPGTVR